MRNPPGPHNSAPRLAPHVYIDRSESTRTFLIRLIVQKLSDVPIVHAASKDSPLWGDRSASTGLHVRALPVALVAPKS